MRSASAAPVEPVAEHHRRREEGRERVGDPLAGDVGGRAVDGLEQARVALGAEAGRGQHPQRPGQHRRLVAEDVAEEVLGDDRVELGGARDELHRGVVDQQVLELDVGVLGGDPGDHLAPEPRGLEHVGLVDRGDPRRAAVGPGAPDRRLEGGAGDPLDLGHRVLAGVVGGVAVAAAVAEVDAAGQLADDEQVGAGDPVLAQRAGADQRRARPHRAQVGVEAHPLAQAEQALLGARRVGVGRVPFRAADGAEQDGVGAAAGLEHLVGERDAVGVDRAAAHQPLVELELAQRLEQPPRGGDDLGPDPVAGQEDYAWSGS